MAFLTIIVDGAQIMLAAMTQYAQGIAGGLNTFITSLLIDSTGTNPTISNFGGAVFAFGGISLVVGITSLLVHWVCSLGKGY